MKAQGVETWVLPAFQGLDDSDRRSWLSRAKAILKGEKFDQVWIWTVHNEYSDDFLDLIVHLAPIRVGWLGENLFYASKEYAVSPELHERRKNFLRQARALTHVIVAADEVEVEYIREEIGLPAVWWPTAVPLANVVAGYEPPCFKNAVFCGAPYGPRKDFLQEEAVAKVLVTISPPENAFSLPDIFNGLCRENFGALERGEEDSLQDLTAFVQRLGDVRAEIFNVFQRGLARYALSVNLPSYGKCYTSRVVETMGAGRPVLAWKVPNRSRNESLFIENEDIFLYDGDDPDGFAEKVERVLADGSNMRRISENARRKVLSYHTMEIRVRQMLDWISQGTLPVYSDQELSARREKTQDAFYKELFTRNAEWSAPDANTDERIRWQAIEAYLLCICPKSENRPRILEVGCGRGWLGRQLSEYGSYVGIDPVADVVAYGRELYPDIDFRICGLQEMEGEAPFDIIVATEVLEHIDLHRQEDFVSHLYRHLRPGGSVILTTPRAELFQSWERIVEPQPMEYWLDEASLKHLFSIHGFEGRDMKRLHKQMPKVFAVDRGKEGFIAPDFVPLYQAWLFEKPVAAAGESAGDAKENLSDGTERAYKRLSGAELATLFGARKEDVAKVMGGVLDGASLGYRDIVGERRDVVMLDVLNVINGTHYPVSGQHRQPDWEKGWRENLDEFIGSGFDPARLRPKYFDQKRPCRLRGAYVEGEDVHFVYAVTDIFRRWIFSKWFSAVSSVHEFGCGTGHNLVVMSELFPEIKLYGYDWAKASQQILSLLKEKRLMNIEGRFFDFFNGAQEFDLEEGAGVLTFGALEQIGCDFNPFLSRLLEAKPARLRQCGRPGRAV